MTPGPDSGLLSRLLRPAIIRHSNAGDLVVQIVNVVVPLQRHRGQTLLIQSGAIGASADLEAARQLQQRLDARLTRLRTELLVTLVVLGLLLWRYLLLSFFTLAGVTGPIPMQSLSRQPMGTSRVWLTRASTPWAISGATWMR